MLSLFALSVHFCKAEKKLSHPLFTLLIQQFHHFIGVIIRLLFGPFRPWLFFFRLPFFPLFSPEVDVLAGEPVELYVSMCRTSSASR
jgi:hypothetical protein